MRIPTVNQVPPERNLAALDELRMIRRELVAIRKLLDQFCGVYLNAKFQYGTPSDRWRKERPRG